MTPFFLHSLPTALYCALCRFLALELLSGGLKGAHAVDCWGRLATTGNEGILLAASGTFTIAHDPSNLGIGKPPI